MGSGQGKSRRVQATLLQREAAVRHASQMVRSGRVARAGSKELGKSDFYTIRQEPAGKRPYSVVDTETKNVIGIFVSLEDAQRCVHEAEWTDLRSLAQAKEKLNDELEVERVDF